MRVVRLLTAIAVFTVANCEGEPPIEDESCGVKTNADTERTKKIVFYSIGDWGIHHWCDYNPASKHKGLGCKGEEQLKTARSMAKRASVDRPEFVISLGDNFYVSGVTDLQDPAFQVTFEEVYKVTGLTDVPWWLVLGDHDHCGNISAQILYSEVSSTWNMPAAYFVKTVENLRIVFIDSVILEGALATVDQRRFGDVYDPRVNGEVPSELHWEWMESTLSDAYADKSEKGVIDFIMVVAHRPVKSFASRARNEAETMVNQRLEPLLRKYGVDLYLDGHDHAAQHIVDNGVHYVTNGIGGYDAHTIGAVDSSALFSSGGPHGYMKHELSKDELKSTFFFNEEDEGNYSFSIFHD